MKQFHNISYRYPRKSSLYRWVTSRVNYLRTLAELKRKGFIITDVTMQNHDRLYPQGE